VPVRFDAAVSGVEFASHYLALPIEGADPFLHRLLSKALDEEAKSKMTLADNLREVLQRMLLAGNYSTDAVCSMFGLNERTLRRHAYPLSSGKPCRARISG
jgi:AraC-like DNA-binding protein